MIQIDLRNILLTTCLTLCAMAITPPGIARCDADKDDAKRQARAHWENVVNFFGQEDTGEWSLRIQDKDIKARAWFEYLELWHFNREAKKWDQIKVQQFSKAIVLPAQKTSDEPPDSEMLVELKDIEPKTAGVWFAKWKVDDVEGSTLMRVGTSRTANKVDGPVPKNMIKMAVPINLDKSEAMIVPDPRVYCISGGAGKPDPADDKKSK